VHRERLDVVRADDELVGVPSFLGLVVALGLGGSGEPTTDEPKEYEQAELF